MSKRIGVVLSGCGFLDGAEIHEAVLTLYALDRAGATTVCMAPNVEQAQVVNHRTQEPMNEKRNVLVESARIARGQIRDIAEVEARELDGLVLPGGFGAALNLSDFAKKGHGAAVHPAVARLVAEVFAQKKPIGAICIAPSVVAVVLGKDHPTLTIGNDAGTAKEIETCGAKHVDCVTESYVLDADHKVVSTPAYMLGPSIRHVGAGIEQLISEVMRMA
ncbi:MAG: isoprenoid biosynthesis glyoxalase ElbB [Deltaproteobacteria bacterium]|nr:isoprenoid biosynthesis glyoxalase ElbB [Deltaproteobacteria bacterium]